MDSDYVLCNEPLAETKLHEKNAEVDARFGPVSYVASLDKKRDSSDYIVEKLIRKGQLVEIIGKSKAGKSLLVLYLAICMVTGLDFFHKKVSKLKKLLFVNLEIAEEDFHDRIVDAATNLGLNAEQLSGLHYWTLRGVDFDVESIIEALITKVKSEGYEFVVIDPVYLLFTSSDGKDENNNSVVAGVLRKLQKLIKETGVGICVVHHISDKGELAVDMNQLPSGASAFSRMYDVLVALREINIPDNFPQELKQSNRAMRIDYALRGGADVRSENVWMSYPVFREDSSKLVRFCPLLSNSDIKVAEKERSKRFNDAVAYYESRRGE